MILKEHCVRNYRNIEEASLSPGDRLTVICGKNGQGKTNLLESIWLLSGAKSFRGGKDGDLVRKGAPFAEILAMAEGDTGEDMFRIAIGGAEADKKGRFAKINGVDFGRATNLAGHFYAIVFAPNHLSLVKGSPEERRKFLDAALCQLYPGYLGIYKRYLRALTQKNALLKDARRFPDVEYLLDSFDEELAAAGAEMIAHRKRYTKGLFEEAQRTYQSISSGSESCTFGYSPTAETAEELRTVIRERRPADLRAGFCTAGPHREDIEIRIGGEEARVFASQGQQRSAVLSLKLSEAQQIAATTGQQPVMLLDDVLSELDSARQDFLLSRIEGRQVFITSCEASPFDHVQGAVYRMEAGTLSKIK